MKRLPRWVVWPLSVVAVVAALAAIHRWWPNRTSSTILYDDVVVEMHRLYPIYVVKHIHANNVIEMDSRVIAQAKQHPAYVGGEPCWDLDATYRDLKPGTDHEIEIVNGQKLFERKTSIRIHRQNADRTEINVSSIGSEFLFNTTSRDFFYERDRLREIKRQLRR